MEIVLHSSVKQELKQIINNPPHALLVVGNSGRGKSTLTTYLSSKILSVDTKNIDSYPYFRRIKPEKNNISIDTIRELFGFTKLKIVNKNKIQRIVVIENAHLMTPETQNALLKLLEEPPKGTMFILTTTSVSELLPTIVSRVAVIKLARPEPSSLEKYFKERGYKISQIQNAYNISGGEPGLMSDLLTKPNQPLVVNIKLAKELLGSSVYDRLRAVDHLAKQKDELEVFVAALKRLSMAALRQTTEHKSIKAKKWHSIASEITEKEQSLSRNPNAKLWLTDLLLRI